MAHDHAWLDCPEEGCERKFLNKATLADHAEAVHTFSDIERAVSEAVREKFGKDNGPNLPRIYAWVNDLADDWVVFTIEAPNQCDLMKASYVFDEANGTVTIGDPVEVVRKTVYEPVKKD